MTSDVLELIHTDICGPFLAVAWNDQQYFMTFINDFSRYGYIYLLYEKSQSLDMFKNFKVLNSARELKASYLTVVVTTMVDMTVQVNNVQEHLLNF